jgi:hypothetical protein
MLLSDWDLQFQDLHSPHQLENCYTWFDGTQSLQQVQSKGLQQDAPEIWSSNNPIV